MIVPRLEKRRANRRPRANAEPDRLPAIYCSPPLGQTPGSGLCFHPAPRLVHRFGCAPAMAARNRQQPRREIAHLAEHGRFDQDQVRQRLDQLG